MTSPLSKSFSNVPATYSGGRVVHPRRPWWALASPAFVEATGPTASVGAGGCGRLGEVSICAIDCGTVHAHFPITVDDGATVHEVVDRAVHESVSRFQSSPKSAVRLASAVNCPDIVIAPSPPGACSRFEKSPTAGPTYVADPDRIVDVKVEPVSAAVRVAVMDKNANRVGRLAVQWRRCEPNAPTSGSPYRDRRLFTTSVAGSPSGVNVQVPPNAVMFRGRSSPPQSPNNCTVSQAKYPAKSLDRFRGSASVREWEFRWIIRRHHRTVISCARPSGMHSDFAWPYRSARLQE